MYCFLVHRRALDLRLLRDSVMSCLYCLWDILDDLVFRKVHESDASKFSQMCCGGCMSSRVWGVIWFFISLIFLIAGILIGLAAFKGTSRICAYITYTHSTLQMMHKPSDRNPTPLGPNRHALFCPEFLLFRIVNSCTCF